MQYHRRFAINESTVSCMYGCAVSSRQWRILRAYLKATDRLVHSSRRSLVVKTTRSCVHALRNVVLVRIWRSKYVVWLHSQAISKPLSMSRRGRTVFLIRVRSLPRTLSRRSSQAVSVKIYDSSTGSELGSCFVSPGEGKIQRILKIVSVKKTTKKRKPWLQVITCAAPLSTASTYGVGNIHVVNYPTTGSKRVFVTPINDDAVTNAATCTDAKHFTRHDVHTWTTSPATFILELISP